VQDDVKKLLEAYGYSSTDEDEWLISYTLEKVQQDVLTFCNLSELPEELQKTVVNFAVAELLNIKVNTGALDITAVKALTMGDTRVEYGASDADAFRELISSLTDRSQLVSFRGLVW
jgi:hypothetical protein